jgi:hypothetical protein
LPVPGVRRLHGRALAWEGDGRFHVVPGISGAVEDAEFVIVLPDYDGVGRDVRP